MTGGGAMLRGLEELIEERTGINTMTAGRSDESSGYRYRTVCGIFERAKRFQKDEFQESDPEKRVKLPAEGISGGFFSIWCNPGERKMKEDIWRR